MAKEKKTILITDDSAMNRALLAEMLEDNYTIIEAENGRQAIELMQLHGAGIELVLLDIVMPEMDGFEVLKIMNHHRWTDDIPVIMSSAETAPQYTKRAYDLGATDFINRPFDFEVVKRRIGNAIMLYSKQKTLIDAVCRQIAEKEKYNALMVSILSHIVEFRNGESGLHVLHIHTLTETLCRKLAEKTDRYRLGAQDIALISTASSLHDIGKIVIPESILNKPGKLTAAEFEIIKSHSAAGAEMMNDLPVDNDEPLIRYAYEICRWHHERFDGKGYPDGLVGDEIPIAAQVVAVADVYDALTGERCYKSAFSHEKAVRMILDGECGAFNPILLECLRESEAELKEKLHVSAADDRFDSGASARRVIEDADSADHSFAEVYERLGEERAKRCYLAKRTDGMFFVFNRAERSLMLLGKAASGSACR